MSSLPPDREAPAAIPAAAGIVIAALGVQLLAPRPGNDFATYYIAATRLLATGSPYADAPSPLCGDCPPYAYPPLLALAIAPLTALPLPVATEVWGALNLAATALLGALLATAAGSPGRRGALLATAALLASVHQLQGTQLGQVHNLVALGMLAPLVLGRAGRPGAAGVVLGLATGLKLFPALLVLPWLRARDARALTGFAGALAAPVILWPRLHAAYVRDALWSGAIPLPLGSAHVVSWPSVARRLFRVTESTTPWIASPLAERVFVGAVAAAVGSVIVAGLVRSRRDADVWALVAVGALIASPGVGVYHLNVAVAALVLALSGPPVAWTWALRGVLGAGLALLALPVAWGAGARAFVDRNLHDGPATLLLVPQAWGLALVYVALAAIVLARR